MEVTINKAWTVLAVAIVAFAVIIKLCSPEPIPPGQFNAATNAAYLQGRMDGATRDQMLGTLAVDVQRLFTNDFKLQARLVRVERSADSLWRLQTADPVTASVPDGTNAPPADAVPATNTVPVPPGN